MTPDSPVTSPDATENVKPLVSARALVQHIQEHPEDSAEPIGLAERFGLPEDLVSEVLRGVGLRRQADVGAEVLSIFGKLELALRVTFRVLTKYPVLFVALTTAALAVSIPWLASRGTGAVAIGFATMFGLHILCYLRHAQARVALLGALAVWMVLSTTVVVSTWLTTEHSKAAGDFSVQATVTALSTLILAILYGLVGSVAAVTGGYLRAKHDDDRDRRMSRQELLARLFQVREALKYSTSDKERRGRRLLPDLWFEDFGRRPWLHTAAISVSTTLVSITLMHVVNAPLVSSAIQVPNALQLLVMASMVALGLLSSTGIAYLAGKFRKALPLTLWGFGLSAVTDTIPIPPFGPSAVALFFHGIGLFANLGAVLLTAALGSMGALVESRALRERRLRENDENALVAELVRLEVQLSRGANEVCVVVVDAAKSAEMKANEDPFEAEYSFREYQKLLARICSANRGVVHSTAGDGAVLAFRDVRNAFNAAREIQTEISFFNEHLNRMKSKFRLRVGLHMGYVGGELRDVEFTEVIDIAAHVQASAPLRGIVVTREVADDLPEESLIPLKEPVDGHEVLLAYNPTVDL